MPKDATKNVDRYKIRGGQINEFDFHRNQEQVTEQKQKSAAKSAGTKKAAKKRKAAKK